MLFHVPDMFMYLTWCSMYLTCCSCTWHVVPCTWHAILCTCHVFYVPDMLVYVPVMNGGSGNGSSCWLMAYTRTRYWRCTVRGEGSGPGCLLGSRAIVSRPANINLLDVCPKKLLNRRFFILIKFYFQISSLSNFSF